MAKETRRIRNSTLDLLEFNPRSALFRDNILLPILSQDLIFAHKHPVQLQEKNKWAWVSSSHRQKAQVGSIGRNCNLSRVRSLPITASQSMKLCLGKDHCSQTTWLHETVEPTGLKKSYAWARKGHAEADQLLIKETHSPSESPQCWRRRSRIEMMAFHSGEEEYWELFFFLIKC